MIKNKISVLVIISILAFMFTSAFTDQPQLNINLLAVSFKREKGVTFKFLVDGDLHKRDMKGGSVWVDGKSLRLYCNYSGDPAPTVVTCTSARGTAAKYAGRPALVSVAGHYFYFIVPARSDKR